MHPTVSTPQDDVHSSRQSSHHLAQHSIHPQLQDLHEQYNQSCRSPLEVLLDKPVRVPRKPRSVFQAAERYCSTAIRAQGATFGADKSAPWNAPLQSLEAPRKHMGRKTRAKAQRNQRYALVLQALERTELGHGCSSENDADVANIGPHSAAVPNHLPMEQCRGQDVCNVSAGGLCVGPGTPSGHVGHPRDTAYLKQSPLPKKPCMGQTAMPAVRVRSPCQREPVTVSEPFVGIVGSVLANLRGCG
jgi:hypothetical protein